MLQVKLMPPYMETVTGPLGSALKSVEVTRESQREESETIIIFIYLFINYILCTEALQRGIEMHTPEKKYLE